MCAAGTDVTYVAEVSVQKKGECIDANVEEMSTISYP